MAFDINDPANLLALKTEVNTDPAGVGYDPAGNTDVLLGLLNNAASNPGAETGVPPLTLGNLWEAIVGAGSTATQFEFEMQLLYGMSNDNGADTDVSRYRQIIRNEASVAVRNNIDAMSRDLSRAEVLFATLDANGTTEYVSITSDEWQAARDS